MCESVGGYTPPLCIWKVVQEAATPEKLPIFRSLIGESKVEYASDLRNELETLLDIWSELYSGTLPDVRVTRRKVILPEPPQQREMLVKEIQLLLENLKDKEAGGLGFIPSDCDKTILTYTNHIAEQQTPPPSTPIPMLRAASRNSTNSILNDSEIEDVAKNLPLFDNETPIQALQNAIQSECNILLEDIEYVRKCVEEGRCDFEEVPEPSLTELRQERKKLENHFIKSIEISPITRELVKPNSVPSTPVKSKRKSASTIKKELPPVRPSSAAQYSKRDTKTKEISKSRSNTSKISQTPTLGGRSHTYPQETNLKSKKVVKRRNSMSALPIRSSQSLSSSADLDSSIEFHNYGRRHGGTFCASPDSGVASRPTSELTMVDSLDMLKSPMRNLETNFTDMKIGNSFTVTPFKANHNVVSGFNWQSISNTTSKAAYPPSESLHPYQVSEAIVPKPPTQRKTRPSLRSARFHKVKATGKQGS